MLVSILVVAALVESGLAGGRAEKPTFRVLRERYWARKMANLLIGTVVVCVLATVVALAYACTDLCVLAVATVAFFLASLAIFSISCVVVLKTLRDRMG